MSRPRKRIPASDRVIIAMRDVIVRAGGLDVIVGANGRRRSARPPGMAVGPGYSPPAGVVRMQIRVGRGRPRPHEIGIVDAVALACGRSTRVVARVLANVPRSGRGAKQHSTKNCPLCGLPPCCDPVSSPSRHDLGAIPPAADALAAVGLTAIPAPTKPILQPTDAILASLCESLDAALAMGAIPTAQIMAAETLLVAVRK